ncbi:hypothetical protein CLOLEP_03748 [[Clostridium] leptum DSM 753]|uniref:Uncharacterized protein n=1 Tax=[Clostridium] leptum DSM 753 TaxID=428125 RepID=A7VYS0_9FIRM|nr:hypothetical protein CLOLEP_03748 [[Clostridium] leptum DSM 753]
MISATETKRFTSFLYPSYFMAWDFSACNQIKNCDLFRT